MCIEFVVRRNDVRLKQGSTGFMCGLCRSAIYMETNGNAFSDNPSQEPAVLECNPRVMVGQRGEIVVCKRCSSDDESLSRLSDAKHGALRDRLLAAYEGVLEEGYGMTEHAEVDTSFCSVVA